MVLLDDVVVSARSHSYVPPARMFAPQQPQRSSTRHVTVERDFARHLGQRGRERPSKERLCCRDSTVAAQQEIDGPAVLVDGAVEVVPLRLDRDMRLIDAP